MAGREREGAGEGDVPGLVERIDGLEPVRRGLLIVERVVPERSRREKQPCMEGNAGRGEPRIEEAVRQRDTVGLERVGGGEEACVAGIFELEAVIALQDAERARERAAG